MKKEKLFKAGQFTPTEFYTAEDKAKFANAFVRLVEGDFAPGLFPKWFYTNLTNCFGHIAHFDQSGFYATWFTSNEKKLRFLVNAGRFPAYGDPEFTFCDVEKALKTWIAGSGAVQRYTEKLDAEIKGHELAELARLKAKYPEDV